MDCLVDHTKFSFSKVFAQDEISNGKLTRNRFWWLPMAGCGSRVVDVGLGRRKLGRFSFFQITLKSMNFRFGTVDFIRKIVCWLIFMNIQSQLVLVESLIIARFLVFRRIVLVVILFLESFNIFFPLGATIDLAFHQNLHLSFLLFFFRLQSSFSIFF